MSLTDIRKNVCIYAHCVTHTELIMGEAGKNSACAMDMIFDELKSNNIEIDIETLSFHINTCLREHGEIYQTAINRIDRDNISMILCDIYEDMNPNNFGRLIAYLTLVYKIGDSYEEEIVREAVQRTVENLKHIDLEKYKVGRFISYKTLLDQLFIRLISAYFT